MTSLESILAPLPLGEFMATAWEKKAVLIPGQHHKFKDLFGWSSLNRVLNSAPAPHPSLKLYKQGKRVSARDSIEVIRQTQAGATLIVDDIDRYDLALGRFLDRFGDEIGERVRFNLYLSYPEEQGFRKHYDTQDFFILQIAGTKRWKVYGGTIQSPLFYAKTHSTEPPPEESLYLDCILRTGDVLYCPRGHWHEALAEQEPSMHLTLGIFVANAIDLLSWVTDELRSKESLRKSFPLLLKQRRTTEQLRSNEELASRLTSIQVAVSAVLQQPDLLADFYRHRTATQRNRSPFNFPHHFEDFDDIDPDQAIVRLPHATDLRAGPEAVELTFDGRLLSFPLRSYEFLESVLSKDCFTMRQLRVESNGLAIDEAAKVIRVLAQEGIVAFES